ncbi:MAG: hypothetical protein KKH28_09665 [Elusimicrobia bacterium]|nr:hypothetical protein [Elusimicrobiota bacterium]
MKKLSGIVVSLLFASASGFADESKITFDQTGSITEIINQAEQAAPDLISVPVLSISPDEKVSKVKEWTVMVFVNAKNNLERFGLKDVNEMEMIGSTGEVNIVVELGRITGYDTSDGDWKGSRRYLIEKDASTSKVTSPVLMEIAKSDMGDWKHFVEFTKWAQEKFPAKNYMLIVWNHGNGWSKDIRFESNKGISYDSETGNHMSTPQLAQALAQIGKIQILGMDACLMQMIEVGYEIRDYAEYIVASEETEPADGYTYNTFLGPLVAKPGMTPKEFSKVTVDSYVNHYQSTGRGATQSSINAQALDKFTKLLDDWTTEVINANEIALVKDAKSKAQSFYLKANKDIHHFIKLVTAGTQNQAALERGKAMLNFMDTEVVVHNRKYGAKYANAYGLAVYLPDSYSTNYDTLQWANDSKWDDFIKWSVK